MSNTVCKGELSKKSKWYVSKNRYLELKYFSLQYPEWKAEYAWTAGLNNDSELDISTQDPTGDTGVILERLAAKIKIVEDTLLEVDEYLLPYLKLGITRGASFNWMNSRGPVPCDRKTYYDRYRKYFYLLDKKIG